MKINNDLAVFQDSDFDGFSDEVKKAMQLLSERERLSTISDLYNRASENLVNEAMPLLKSDGAAKVDDLLAEFAKATPEKVASAKAAALAELQKK